MRTTCRTRQPREHAGRAPGGPRATEGREDEERAEGEVLGPEVGF